MNLDVLNTAFRNASRIANGDEAMQRDINEARDRAKKELGYK